MSKAGDRLKTVLAGILVTLGILLGWVTPRGCGPETTLVPIVTYVPVTELPQLREQFQFTGELSRCQDLPVATETRTEVAPVICMLETAK